MDGAELKLLALASGVMESIAQTMSSS
jgi:hypothetical protein